MCSKVWSCVFDDEILKFLVYCRVNESTERSQILAYFSFTPIDHGILGLQPKGGKRVEHTGELGSSAPALAPTLIHCAHYLTQSGCTSLT
jgi:hypothetical protein